MSKDPGGMILADSTSGHYTEHTIMIPCNHNKEDDMLVISNMFDFSFSIMNCRTGDDKKVFYHLEIDKKSAFYRNFREVMKEIMDLKDKNET